MALLRKDSGGLRGRRLPESRRRLRGLLSDIDRRLVPSLGNANPTISEPTLLCGAVGTPTLMFLAASRSAIPPTQGSLRPTISHPLRHTIGHPLRRGGGRGLRCGRALEG